MFMYRVVVLWLLIAFGGCEYRHDPICATAGQDGSLQRTTSPMESDAFRLSPFAVTVVTGGSVQFAVLGSASQSSSITWRVEGVDRGLISNGRFDAPEKPGVFHIIAETKVYDFDGRGGACGNFEASTSLPPPKELLEHHLARATVTVVPPHLVIVPSWAVVATNSITRFQAVSNLEERGPVTWVLGESMGGTVKSPDEDDLYFTAKEIPGTFHIRAFLQDRPEIEAFLAVTVATAPDPITGP